MLKISINKQYAKWNTKIVRQMLQAMWPLILVEFPLLQQLSTCNISLLLTDDAEMRELKKQFFGLDAATNVLSFPGYNEISDLQIDPFLGDIALGYNYLLKESIAQNKTWEQHLQHMLLHGLLHLCGLDHVKEQDAEYMESIEIKILAHFGIQNPYLIIT